MEYKEKLNRERYESADNSSPQKSKPSPPKEPSLNHLVFMFAIGIAILKDLLDLVGIGSLPVVGTLITFAFMFAIAMLIFLAAPKFFLGNLWYLLFGGGTESLFFGLNFLPLLTATVVVMYIRTILKRKAKQKLRKQKILAI